MNYWKRAALAVTLLTVSGSALSATIQLQIENIETLAGNIMVVLYNSEESYSSSGAPIATRKLDAGSHIVSTTFENMESGDYAIKLFHDENSNGALDTNLLGLPSEGYGFSNNAGRFGPADYSEAKFSVVNDTSLTIRLR